MGLDCESERTNPDSEALYQQVSNEVLVAISHLSVLLIAIAVGGQEYDMLV